MSSPKLSHRRSKSLGDITGLPLPDDEVKAPDTPQTPKSAKSARFSVSPKLGLKPVYLLGRRSWYNLRGKFKQDETTRGFELISSSVQSGERSIDYLPLPVNQSSSTIVGSSSSQLRLAPSPVPLGEPYGGYDSHYSVITPEDSDRESAFSYEGPFRQLSMHLYKRQSTLYDYDSENEDDMYMWSANDDDVEDLSHLEDPMAGFYQHSNINTIAFSPRSSYDDLIDEVCQVSADDERDELVPTLSRSRSECYPRGRNSSAHRRYSLVIRGSERVVTLYSPLTSPVRDSSVRSNRTLLTPISEAAAPSAL